MKRSTKECKFLFICHGKDCRKQGAKDLKKQFIQELKRHRLNKSIQAVSSKCLDRCKFAPSVVFRDQWYGKVKPKDLQDIIGEH